MKRIEIFAFTASLAISALSSCTKETPVENEIQDGQNLFYIKVSSELTKTSLGENGKSILWTTGDKIKVNNHNSIALEDSKNYGTKAEFAFKDGDAPESPYYAVFNALRAYDYDETEHSYRLSLDYNNWTQTWVENSFDPHYSVLYGTGDDENGIEFKHAMAYLLITPTMGSEEVDIAKIIVKSRGGESVSGRFYIDTDNGAMTDYRDNRDFVTMAGPDEGVALGKSFMIAIPAKTYESGLTVRFVDENGNMMEKNSKKLTAVAGTVYPISAVYAHTSVCTPVAYASGVTSSTTCVTWTMGGIAEDDIANAYTVQCSTSEDFSANLVERQIDANSTIWKSATPNFCFGGLAQNTTYYFRVQITGSEAWSNTVSQTTSVYDKTVVSSDAGVGDVIVAEDFACSCEGGEGPLKAAGYGTVAAAFKSYTDAYTNNTVDTWKNFDDISDWGYYNSAKSASTPTLYMQQGHVKLGTGSKQSYLVTPLLSAIPSDKAATIEVEVTAAAYTDDEDRVTEGVVYVGQGSLSDKHLFTLTGTAFSDTVKFTFAEANKLWNTYKVTFTDVRSTDRLVIGSTTDAGNYRMNISDVKVTVKALDTPRVTQITLVSADRTNATFSWNNISTSTFGYGTTYLIEVCKDEACTQPVYKNVVTYDSPLSRYSPYGTSKFIGQKSGSAIAPSALTACCGLLEPATNYWFRVKPIEEDIVVDGTKTKTGKGESTFTNTAEGAPWSDAFAFTTAVEHTADAKEVIYCGFDAINIGPNFETLSAGVSPQMSGFDASASEKIGFVASFAAGTYTNGWFTWTLDRRNQSGGYTVASWGYCVNDSDALYLDGSSKNFTLNGSTKRYNRLGNVGDITGWYITSQCYPNQGHVLLNDEGNFVGTPALTSSLLNDTEATCTVRVKAAKIANDGNADDITIKVYKYSKSTGELNTTTEEATLTIGGSSCYASWTDAKNYTTDFTTENYTCDVNLANGDALVFAVSKPAIIDEIQITKNQ